MGKLKCAKGLFVLRTSYVIIGSRGSPCAEQGQFCSSEIQSFKKKKRKERREAAGRGRKRKDEGGKKEGRRRKKIKIPSFSHTKGQPR